MFAIKTRTQPFYGQWNYCAQFYLPEAHVLRKLDHECIDSTAWTRREWQKRNINFGGSWHYRAQPFTDEMLQTLHDICDFLQADTTPRKIIMYPDHLYVYCNDTDLVKRFMRTGLVRLISATCVKISGTAGNVVLKNPVHKLRTYFKNRRLSAESANSVRHFLSNQSDTRLSPGLTDWIKQNYHMIQSHYFLDHDHESIVTMLNMIAPGIIRKTQPIEVAK